MRHPHITNELLGTECAVIWFRPVAGLRFVRETVLTGPLHVHSVGGGEVLGYSTDCDGQPVRAFYLMHDRPADGIGPFTPDQYNGVAAWPASIEARRQAVAPDQTEVSPEVIAREAEHHANHSAYWKRHAAAHAPPPAPKRSLLSRLTGRG